MTKQAYSPSVFLEFNWLTLLVVLAFIILYFLLPDQPITNFPYVRGISDYFSLLKNDTTFAVQPHHFSLKYLAFLWAILVTFIWSIYHFIVHAREKNNWRLNSATHSWLGGWVKNQSPKYLAFASIIIYTMVYFY